MEEEEEAQAKRVMKKRFRAGQSKDNKAQRSK